MIKAANKRLKVAGGGIAIRRRGSWLHGRGTLPPKPHLAKTRSRAYQQEFPLDFPATQPGVRQAEKKCRILAARLQLGEWDWRDVMDIPHETGDSLGDWVKRFEDDYWTKRDRSNPSAVNNYKVYQQIFNKLDPDKPLNIENLIATVTAITPDTRQRQRASMVLAKLAQLAGIDPKPIKELSGSYSVKAVEPRFLPTDDEILKAIASIDAPGWQWVFRVMAAYGLRPHEVFVLELSEFPTIWVEDPAKTGKRFVYPVPQDWAIEWCLNERSLPRLQELRKENRLDYNLEKLGTKVSRFAYLRKWGFKPYDLRHCFARRCFEAGLPSDLVAKIMGHSLKVQLDVYRAWWDEASYRKIYEEVMRQSFSSSNKMQP